MSKLLAAILVVLSIAGGIYVGVWWGFIGGIIEIVTAFKAATVSASDVAIGFAKVFFAAPLGWATFFAGSAIATVIATWEV